MIVSGHQPAYLPWLGLIHKASLSDVFVFMDDVDYVAQDFINRNQIKTAQGNPHWLSVPVDLKSSASSKIKDIVISRENLSPLKAWPAKHWMSLKSSYSKAPFFKSYADFFEDLYLKREWFRLADLNFYLFENLLNFFGVKTDVKKASEYSFKAKKSDLLLEHCKAFEASILVTGTQGKDYLKKEDFDRAGVAVYHQEYHHPIYSQRFGEFVTHLSAVDLLFNCGDESPSIFQKGNITKDELRKIVSN